MDRQQQQQKPVKPTRTSLIFLDKSLNLLEHPNLSNSTNNNNTMASVPESEECSATASPLTHPPIILRRKQYQQNNNNSLSHSDKLRSRHSEIPVGTSHIDDSRRISRVPSVTESLMSGDPIKMSGYLEKKSKMLGWKKYWFVLDGHLLTYYKSKEEYERLSSFCGSINLGIATTVRPTQSKNFNRLTLEISTRTHVYYLRSPDKEILEQWVLALQETISVPYKISNPTWTSPGAQFYRYSFAALSDSQWSLNSASSNPHNLSDSLSNFPKNFYLKPDGPSFVSEEFKPLKTKCHSFATLPQNRNSSRICTTVVEMDSKSLSPPNRPMSMSSSMLLLESSPQATELKRELNRKLSIGNTITPSIIRGQKKPQISETSSTTRQSESLDTIKYIDDESQSTGHSQQDLTHECENEYSEIVHQQFGQSARNSCDSNIYESIDFTNNNSDKRKSAEIARNSSLLNSITETPEPPQSKLHENREDNFVFKNLTPNKKNKKKSGIVGNIFQKMFKKPDSGGTGESKRKLESGDNANLIISGPVDLREHLRKTIPTPSNPSPIVQPTSAPISSPNLVIDELKSRVGKLNRTVSEAVPSPATLNSEINPHELIRRSTIMPTISDPTTTAPKLNYHEKLAMFNRLSASVNFNHMNMINRSHSCRIKPTNISLDNLPPELPPKKKHLKNRGSTELNPYDVPMNNGPVAVADLICESDLMEPKTKPSLRELLEKKNSAPDILYEIVPSAESPKKSAPVPPRPPKKPNSDSYSQLVSQKERYENEVPSKTHSDLLSAPEVPHSPTLSSSRSVDIDNLDVLSDISDELISETSSPPGTPSRKSSDGQNGDPISSCANLQTELPYANLKFGTVNTILTELETVEEIVDDDSFEEYCEDIQTNCPIDPASESLTYENIICIKPQGSINSKALRTSGIDELQKYLNEEETVQLAGAGNDTKVTNNNMKSGPGRNRVNRLGHSSAMAKLQDAINTEEI